MHLTGVITQGLNIFGSGVSPSQPTTIYFEPNAMMSAPTLVSPNVYWLDLNPGGGANIVINGGVNGIIQCTDNGTGPAYGGTCQYSTPNIVGIYDSSANYLVVENLTISNLYNRLPSSQDPQQGNCNDTALYLAGNNILVQSNVLYNNQEVVDYNAGSSVCSNISVISNNIIGFNHGITVAIGGQNGSPVFYNAIIRSNRLDGMDYYESTNASISYWHRDPVFVFDEANAGGSPSVENPTNYYYGVLSNLDISYNWFGPGINPKTTSAGTSAIFMDNYSTNQFQSVKIYNNIFSLKPPLEWGDGFIDGGFVSGPGNIIANNTIIYWHSNGYYPQEIPIQGGQNYVIANNIEMDGSPGILLLGQPTANCFTGFGPSDMQYVAGFYSGYNVFSTTGSTSFEMGCITCFGNNGQFQPYGPTFSGWQALGANFDNTSSTGTPLLNSLTYVPLASDTVARAQGTNLSSYFANDFYGTPRSTTGAWDIGACAFVVPALTAPTGFHIVSQ